MHKLSRTVKAGTAITLAATSVITLTSCGSEIKELETTNSITGVYENGEMPSQNLPLTQTTVPENKTLEINYEIIREIKEDINTIYKKHFGKDNNSVDGIITNGGDNNICLGENFEVYYPEGSIVKNTENRYIINLSISAINNPEALNGFLKEVLSKYNINNLNITDEALNLLDFDIDKVNCLFLYGTPRTTEPVNLVHIKSLNSVYLNNAKAYNFPKTTCRIYIGNDKKYCEIAGIKNYELAYEIEEIEFLPNLNSLWIEGEHLNGKVLKTTAEIITLKNCKGYIDILSSATDLYLDYENIDGNILLRGEYEKLSINSDEEKVLLNFSHSNTLVINFEIVYSAYTR